MGRWSLLNLSGTSSAYHSESIGHNIIVTYRLKYEASTFGSFKELPILEWNEQIFMIEHHSNQWWEFSTNMYQHNPLSNTLKVWAGRYPAAYDHANGIPYMGKGSAKLFDKNGLAIRGAALGRANSNAEKAESVRKYLTKHGGILEITIHDIPSINQPDAATHKERLLVFDCGFAGGGTRFKGTQYLNMNGAVPRSSWIMDFQQHAGNALSTVFTKSTAGKNKVPAPALVSAPRNPNFISGEYW